jgi:2-phosphosulfolactate phosphatase
MQAPKTSGGGYLAQGDYRVRFERGERGVHALTALRFQVGVLIVVDVLSFSTVVDVAVSRGAHVMPSHFKLAAESAELAKLYGAQVVAPRAQRSAESPYTLSAETLDALPRDARLVLPTVNGARCVRAANENRVATILAGCLRNASAVAAFARARAAGTAIAVIAAGERWADGTLRPALEDDLAAGAILAALDADASSSPEAWYIARAYRAGRDTLAETLRDCVSARELIEAGYVADVERSFELDVSATVPVLGPDGFFSAALTTP